MILNSNEYYTGLTNLALYIAMYSTNKTDKSRALVDSLTTEPLEYGDTKIFRTIPMPQVGNYSDNSSLLEKAIASFTPKGTQTAVNVVEDVLSLSKKKLIKSTYNIEMLKLAVKSEYGVNDFVSTVLSNIDAAKIDFLYDLVVNDLYTLIPGATEEVEVLDLSEQTLPSEIQAGEILNQKKISLACQKVIDAMTRFSTSYNGYGLKQAVDMSDLRMIVFQPYKNEAVTNLFAELLNSDVINQNFPRPELITIPESKAKESANYDGDVIAIIMHKAAYQLSFKLQYMGNFFDSSTMNVNNFMHFWFLHGWVKQLPTALIKIKGE